MVWASGARNAPAVLGSVVNSLNSNVLLAPRFPSFMSKQQGKPGSEKAKGKMPQKAVPVPKLKSPSYKVSPRLAEYARQFMLPGSATSPIVSPAQGSCQLCARHIHRTVDIGSGTYPGGFTAVMSPDLFNPGFYTAAANIIIPPAAPGTLSGSGNISGDGSGPGPQSAINCGIWWSDNSGNKVLTFTQNITDSAAVTYAGVPLVPVPVATNYLINMKAVEGPVHIATYSKIAGGPWVSRQDNTLAKNQEVSVGGTFPINTDSIAFTFLDTDADSYPKCKFAIGINSAQVSALGTSSYAPAFKQQAFDNNITVGRVVSMSLLATNTSPDVARGGNINAARCPRSIKMFNQNIAQDISGLPENRRYQGPASEGAYVWWMPAQLDELEPDGVELKAQAYDNAEFLIVNVQGWAPGAGLGNASMRLQFDWLVEFYTPSQAFEKIQTPPMMDEFELLLHRLLMMPAATCNPGHKDLWPGLKKTLRQGVSYGKEAYAFYNRHQDLFNSIAAALLAALA